jgi:His/Glu/Gln/Arg/opine family amino acid ABC transporter permease subunit
MVDLSPILENWRFLQRAVETTLLVSALGMAVALAVGLLLGLARTYGPRWLDIILGFYVDTMRSVPLLVILIWLFFAFPLIAGIAVRPFTIAVAGLGLHGAAYVGEVIRSGLTSVRDGQMRAALALGMSRVQAVRTVILPQALVRMLPPLGSQFVIIIKDSAITAVIAVPEIMRQSQVLAGQTFRPFEIYTVAMIVYFLILFPVARGIDMLYRRVAHLGAS